MNSTSNSFPATGALGLLMSVLSITGCSLSNSNDIADKSLDSEKEIELNSFERDDRQHLSMALYQIQHARSVSFYRASTELNSAVGAYCLSQQQAIIGPWRTAMERWMGLQGQERGPELALEQNWSVQFWPDKKNTLGRQMSGLMRNQPDISVEALSQQSVTLQGLGAVEWLLFDPATSAYSDEDVCQLMETITEHIVLTSTTIATAWQENPWGGLSDKEWQQEQFSLVNNQLDLMLKKLSLPLAKIGQPNPYFSESWRSESSYANLYANLEELQITLMAPNGIVMSLRAIDSPVAERIEEAISQTISQWPARETLFASLPSKNGYRQGLSAYNQLDYLNYLLSQEASAALGVSIGFNATDGD